ncbi:carboxyl-terminal protease [Rippkaea orientalis PCC 8801]|uniref:Carboxyl-terminal-processing protease n=1 Tax=Rippkaea orientalis (strain PCC 8801 / RF-1) TaxID=41431 RepID=B7K6C6_RIPO1|nr:carboxyl-terminal processing protease CtpC [Rippkaea orientalis]ACK68179.1 carboxyl-terminal protease [Rippkaea orientalis PCC 8801]
MVNQKRGLILGATAAILSAVAVTGGGLRLSQSQAFFQDNPKELVDEVWQVINRTYVDATFNQVDWRKVRQEYLNRPYSNKEEAYKAIREMLEKLGDPYTRFMDPEEFKNMQIDTSGELTGVGIQLTKDEETNELTVVAPIEETPAFEAGILSKDVIVKIDGKTTKGMEVEDAVKLIRGKPGSQVTLTIRRTGQEMEYPLTRTRIELHPVKARATETPAGTIGYIRLTQFSAQAGEEMRDAIKDLESKKVTGYILDLRSNPGGLLYSSIEIARMWLDNGKIVSTVNREGEMEQQQASNRALTNKPLVVLVDGGSASASEILSGALQDHKRAVVVGTKTFGKGLVQSVRGLGDGSGLAVTIAKYLTPNGRDINKHGIDPDVVLELSDEERKALQKERDRIGNFGDPQFEKAFEVLKQQIATSQKTNAQAPRQ